MNISRVYIASWKGDHHLARLCVASVRYWYPDIPITLIKDEYLGAFDCDDLYEHWNVELFPGSLSLGGGYGKLEPLFLPRKESYLMLDADLILLGPLLDAFRLKKADFVVSPEGVGNTSHIGSLAYRLEDLSSFDPGFQPPDFMFNTGQYAATSGCLKREDFDPLLHWTEPRTLKRPDLFFYTDQGITNYVFFKAFQEKRIRLAQNHFYLWGGMDFSGISPNHLRARNGLPRVLHWAGPKPDKIEDFKHGELLKFYRDFYEWRMARAKAVRPRCPSTHSDEEPAPVMDLP